MGTRADRRRPSHWLATSTLPRAAGGWAAGAAAAGAGAARRRRDIGTGADAGTDAGADMGNFYLVCPQTQN